MAGLSYVVRFTHNGNFDRKTDAKARDRDLNRKTGVVNLKTPGAAEKNKEIDLVRSRFLEVLSWIHNSKLELNLDTFKAQYLEMEKHLGFWEKDSHKRNVRLTYNSLADDLYLEIVVKEGELEILRAKLNKILYPVDEREARLLSTAFDTFLKTPHILKLTEATKKNYRVTKRLTERLLPGTMVHELNQQVLEDFGTRWLATSTRASSLNEH